MRVVVARPGGVFEPKKALAFNSNPKEGNMAAGKVATIHYSFMSSDDYG
jgi:hypothetical protein